jgi:preprotein translocase subunit SecY
MKKFIESISNVWKIEELNRILITLGLLLVYRFGAHVTLPGIDATQLNSLAGQTKSGIGSILDMFWWSVLCVSFALGIIHFGFYCCSANGNCDSYLQKLQSDESGRKD